ncbi:MAG: response regulator [Gammaproteobacteria bacterium]|nr:MAG: response regulator [Gammaproteobacteria bacterium]
MDTRYTEVYREAAGEVIMSRTALIVDDSATARHMLARVLKGLDFQCLFAQSGQEALDQLKFEQPDIIFLDHLMPGLNGFQTLEAIKHEPRTADIPVVMYTSQNATKYQEEALALGAVGVITKQVDKEALYVLVEKVCTEHSFNEVANGNGQHAGVRETETDSASRETESAQTSNVVPLHPPKRPTYSPGASDSQSETLTRPAEQRLNALERSLRMTRWLVFLLLLITLVMGLELIRRGNQQESLYLQLEGHRKALQELIDLVEPPPASPESP